MRVVFLEEVYYVATDQSDGERIEYRLGSGFWANPRKLAAAKRRLAGSLAEGWHLEETEYEVDAGPNQRRLYVLNHEYSLPDGTCHYYCFPPRTSRRKCLLQKAELKENPKYAHREGRLYDPRNGGWFVEEYEIVY